MHEVSARVHQGCDVSHPSSNASLALPFAVAPSLVYVPRIDLASCVSQGMEMPAGALHWLPTELPAGVRFIVSTIATTDKGGTQKPHRTYLELLRR